MNVQLARWALKLLKINHETWRKCMNKDLGKNKQEIWWMSGVKEWVNRKALVNWSIYDMNHLNSPLDLILGNPCACMQLRFLSVWLMNDAFTFVILLFLCRFRTLNHVSFTIRKLCDEYLTTCPYSMFFQFYIHVDVLCT